MQKRGGGKKLKITEPLKLFKEDERGISSIFIGVLVALFGASVVYALTFDILVVQIFNLMIDIAPSNTPQAYFDNLNRFRLLYQVLPFVFFFGIIMWAYVLAQKKMYAT